MLSFTWSISVMFKFFISCLCKTWLHIILIYDRFLSYFYLYFCYSIQPRFFDGFVPLLNHYQDDSKLYSWDESPSFARFSDAGSARLFFYFGHGIRSAVSAQFFRIWRVSARHARYEGGSQRSYRRLKHETLVLLTPPSCLHGAYIRHSSSVDEALRCWERCRGFDTQAGGMQKRSGTLLYPRETPLRLWDMNAFQTGYFILVYYECERNLFLFSFIHLKLDLTKPDLT